MSDRNIVDYSGLQAYDAKIKDYISTVGDAAYSPISHTHYLGDIGFTPEEGTIPADDVSRLKGFRNCQIFVNYDNDNITIDTDKYDLAYINVSRDINITLKIGVTEGVSPRSHARCLKIILKNAYNHEITWNYSGNIIWRDNDSSFSDEPNKVDIVDLITAGLNANEESDDNTVTNPTSMVIWYASVSKSY